MASHAMSMARPEQRSVSVIGDLIRMDEIRNLENTLFPALFRKPAHASLISIKQFAAELRLMAPHR
jgi:hypothetical protein